MKLHLLLPRVEPETLVEPTTCPYAGCDGKRLRWHQDVPKAIGDTKYEQVLAQRYQCLRVQTNVSRLSTRRELSTNLVTSQRISGDALPLRTQLWSDVPGLGSAGGVVLQKSGVLRGARSSQSGAGSQTGSGV